MDGGRLASLAILGWLLKQPKRNQNDHSWKIYALIQKNKKKKLEKKKMNLKWQILGYLVECSMSKQVLWRNLVL